MIHNLKKKIGILKDFPVIKDSSIESSNELRAENMKKM
jgi:hypothetical protein